MYLAGLIIKGTGLLYAGVEVCPVWGISPPHSFNVFCVFSIKFCKSPPHILQTFQSGLFARVCRQPDTDRIQNYKYGLLPNYRAGYA